MNQETKQMLIRRALEAREASYAPYSGFSVGAALLTVDGKVYTGANIESSAFSPTVCAERVAFFTAVHAGERQFAAMAIVGGKANTSVCTYCFPCGVCRQVMVEFCSSEFPVILYDGANEKVCTLGELLPNNFGAGNLK